jgi:hypothetical protein
LARLSASESASAIERFRPTLSCPLVFGSLRFCRWLAIGRSALCTRGMTEHDIVIDRGWGWSVARRAPSPGSACRLGRHGSAERHGLEKIKTTGDNYMVVSGVPGARPDHAAAVVRRGIEMLDAAGRMQDPNGCGVSIRIGIGSGPVVAGVVETKKFFYDIWCDAVNVASRMESTGRAWQDPDFFGNLRAG